MTTDSDRLFPGTVQSCGQFERLVCEIPVGEAYGIIVSEESPGTYLASISTFLPDQEKIYDECLNVPAAQVRVDILISSLQRAIDMLKAV